MKKYLKLSNLNSFELRKDEINSVVAGEAGICDYACGCSCACNTGDDYGATNTANGNASSTESVGYVQAGTGTVIGIIATFFRIKWL